jgi:F0F1-type ATP synthase membrane subunit b/b'
MDLNLFSQYFRSSELLTSLSFEEIIKHYNEYKITNKKLKELREEFFMDQVQTKLNNPNTEWEDDQKALVISYRNDLENHLLMVKEPVENLQKKIEKINKDYEYKLEKYEKQFEIVSNLTIKIDAQNEAKTGYENILKRINNKNENNNDNSDNKISCLNSDDKKNNEGIIGSILNFFTVDNSENAKIQKKIKDINKNIDDNNKLLDSNKKLLDKYKKELEMCKNEQNMLQQQLENIENKSKKTKKELLKNLSEKLKLSAKFVATSKY